jgi:molecular chaperone DnaK
MSGAIFGIDLGTTYSVIAQVGTSGEPEVLPNQFNELTTPSVVLYESPTNVVVGSDAKNSALTDPDRVVSLVKRHIGEPGWMFSVDGEAYSPAAISAQILAQLAEDAEIATGTAVKGVVITVPAYFGEAERQCTRDAGLTAGLDVLDVINEPTAAAFAYGFDDPTTTGKTVLVYDLGGGTFDVTVIQIAAGEITVLATGGDRRLGGADWDEDLVAFLSARFREQFPEAGDPLNDIHVRQDLLAAAEAAKKALSSRERTRVPIVHAGERTQIEITRQDFEELTAPRLERTIDFTQEVLTVAAEKGAGPIDEILLVGGSSRMPVVATRLEQRFGLAPRLADPDLSVAKGAALWALRKSLGNEVDLEAPGADAALAEAAERHGLSTDNVRDIISTRFTNVCSQGFGTDPLDDSETVFVDFLVHRNDPLPVEVERTYGTVRDDQSAVRLAIYEQGGEMESRDPADNVLLQEGEITGIPRGHPRGTPITVHFHMDEAALITVTASHPGAAERLSLSVETGAALSADELAAERTRFSASTRAA